MNGKSRRGKSGHPCLYPAFGKVMGDPAFSSGKVMSDPAFSQLLVSPGCSWKRAIVLPMLSFSNFTGANTAALDLAIGQVVERLA
jgi:hypothetical protein